MNIRQEGGKRAAKKVKETYGENFFKEIGAKGGKKSRAADPEDVIQMAVDINNEYTILSNGSLIGKDGSIKKPQLDSKGYLRVQVYVDGKAVTEKMHRLVARHFIPNPDNKPQVNHIDGDKTNNYVENLGWVTNKENFDHALSNGLMDNIFNKKVKRLLPQVTQAIIDGYLLKDICALNDLPYGTTMKYIGTVEPEPVVELDLGRKKQFYYYDSARQKYRVVKKDSGIPSKSFDTEEEARHYVDTHRGGGFTGDPQRASEAGKAGVRKRWAKYYAEKGEN